MTRWTVLLCALILTALAGCQTVILRAPAPSTVTVAAGEVAAGDGLYPFQAGGQWGYMEADGVVAVAPAFDAADVFSEGRAAVRVGAGWGYADPSGRLAVPATYASAGGFSQGRGLVAVGDGQRRRFGFVDPAGAEVVPPVLLQAYPYADGRALVRLRDKVPTFLERLFGASEAFGFLDRDGALAFMVPGQASSFAEGLAPFSEFEPFSSGNWGYVRTDGSVAVEPRSWSRAYGFSGGLARVARGRRMEFVRPDGSPAFPATFEIAGPFAEGLAPVLADGRWGYVDGSGALVVPAQFEQAGSFAGGLAAVQQGGRWGYVGPDGALAIAPAYASAQAFRGPLALVTDSAGTYYIDRQGRAVRPTLR